MYFQNVLWALYEDCLNPSILTLEEVAVYLETFFRSYK